MSWSPYDQVDSLVLMLSSPGALSLDPRLQQKVTRTVAVPTSEHVAQIVGQGGYKIKLLRQSTSTYIKTPLRDDEPIFFVTGAPQDVEKAIDSIQKAAQHFSKVMNDKSTECAVGEVSITVEVPRKYVGSVVGIKGRVIKSIKEETNTRINTPKGSQECPAFTVTGRQEDVFRAKKAIEDRIKMAAVKELSDAVYNSPAKSIRSRLFGPKPTRNAIYEMELNINDPIKGSEELLNYLYSL